MLDFTFYNPTRLVFGRDQIAQLADLAPQAGKICLVYGGGSIKKNGVYEQVIKALGDRKLIEFGGIEPNPRYETCMRAARLINDEQADFILAVGGGSVLDACKFIAAAAVYAGDDPWDILAKGEAVEAALPLATVLTLPATGSEMNGTSVISRDSVQQKLFFVSDLVRPIFSILDPATSVSLPPRQTANGVVDAFVHTCEQYMTYPADAPLQDRMSEGVLATLLEEGPKVLAKPDDLVARANIMWCATIGLNGLLGLGVPQDWASHMIGHELTALYGLDHAQSLAVVLPGVWRYGIEAKRVKLEQFATRVLGLSSAEEAIDSTEQFFRTMGVGTTFADYKIPAEACELVAKRMEDRSMVCGEHQDITHDAILTILKSRM